MDKRAICISVIVEDPSTLVKVSEQFSRTLSGLAMDGVYGNVYIYDPTEEDEEE